MSTLTANKSKEQASIAQATAEITIIKDCVFTNNSTQDVVVLKAYSDTDTTPPLEIFEQTLTILKTKDDKQIIPANGGTGTITLDDTHKDSDGNDTDTTSYEFIIARADSLFPVKSASTIRAYNTDKTQKYYPGVTVVKTTVNNKTVDDYANMQSAEQFQKNIMAYPSYSLAQNYLIALSQTASAPATDATDYIGNYFSKTDLYQNVTLDMIAAISTYYGQFPYVWTDYKATKTYYLYSTINDVVKYAGFLVITCPTVVPASTDKDLTGFTFVFTDVTNKNAITDLHYYKGQLVDVKTDVPGMCFTGSFARQGDLTNDNSDNTVISVIAGRIGSLKVMGFDQKQTETVVTDDNGNTSTKWSGMYDLLHADNLGKVVTLVMTAGGLVMAFREAFGGIKYLKDKIRGKQADKANAGDDSPLSKADFDALKVKLDAYNAARNSDNQAAVQRLDPSAQAVKPEDLKTAMDNYSKQITDQVTASLKNHLYDALDAQNTLLEKILDYTSSPATDKASDDIQELGDKLDNANTTDEISNIATAATAKVTSINYDLLETFGIAFKKATGAAKTEIQDAKTEADTRDAENQALDQQRQEKENENEPEDNEYPPEDWDA